MCTDDEDGQETLSQRENRNLRSEGTQIGDREIVFIYTCGHSSQEYQQEIANTVLPATIYAIVNKLVELSDEKIYNHKVL